VPYQLDGDFGGRLPVEIDMLPRRVTLFVPEAWAMDQKPQD
jgi:diacylglycerol kinase family enzyme